MSQRLKEFAFRENPSLLDDALSRDPEYQEWAEYYDALTKDQRDQDDLPPYEILDGILKAYIEENKGTEEIIDMGYDPSVVRGIMGRIHHNEYKRNQAPPGLKVTTKSFGYGRRFPIAQGYLLASK